MQSPGLVALDSTSVDCSAVFRGRATYSTAWAEQATPVLDTPSHAASVDEIEFGREGPTKLSVNLELEFGGTHVGWIGLRSVAVCLR